MAEKTRAPVGERIASLDWTGVAAALDAGGYGLTGALLTQDECRQLAAGYDDDGLFRARIVMARHNFGRGEYKYFAYPLPDLVETLRQAAYPRLAPIANRWAERMGGAADYPPDLPSLLARCRAAGQGRPTPLILRYGPGDYNCLHQDLYGDVHFPLQLAVLLSRPGPDFRGGEFVLTEQRPRRQSRAMVVPLRQGDGVIFAVNQRPVGGARGDYRTTMRHGVSEVLAGQRHTLGVIFHDAR